VELGVWSWAGIVSACVPFLLGVIPWMVRVYAKLEVVASQLAKVSEQMEINAALLHELHCRTADHAAKLNVHDIRILYLNERIEKLE
jgi:hypothetical protein